MAKMKDWIAAARLRTLPLAIGNIVMGAVVSAYLGYFSWQILALTLLTAILLQILSNFANEYGDFIHGVDHISREGPDRTVQSGAIAASSMKTAMIVTAVISIVSGAILLLNTTLTVELKGLFFILGLIAVWAAINYTSGSSPYGYKGYGDLSVFIFFGLLSVIGSFYLQSNFWSWMILLPAISCGVFSMAVLNINNIRDIKSDAIAGKNSLALRMGRSQAVRYHLSLIIIGMSSAVLFTYLNQHSYLQYLFLIIVPFLYINYTAVKNKENAMELDPYLKQMALTTLLFVVTFSIGLLV